LSDNDVVLLVKFFACFGRMIINNFDHKKKLITSCE
jgi:hypothetical protein